MNNKNVKIKEYDGLVLTSFIWFIIALFYFWFTIYSTWSEMLRVSKVIEYGNDISSISESKVLEDLSVSETNRYYEHIVKLREQKLNKLKYWSKQEKTEILNQYKAFYDLQISKNWILDYHSIASEIAGIWNKMWVKILGISLGTPRLSSNVQFTWDPRYQIYERPVTIDIAKTTDQWFNVYSIKDYEKIKAFLREIRNDVKMPFNSGFELSKQSESEEWYKEGNVKFDRVNLLFFYNHKK